MAVRLYDKEVFAVNREETDRGTLMSFFLKGSREELVCIYEEGRFIGLVEYKGLLMAKDLEAAIEREMVFLSEDMWAEARCYFLENMDRKFLPVLNQEGELESFCYWDDNLTETVVKLWKLRENSDIRLPEYIDINTTCIVIYGFNEAACQLYHFLQEKGAYVLLMDEKWGKLAGEYKNKRMENSQTAEFITIYAEGEGRKSSGTLSQMELCLNDVSGEFGLVDEIFTYNRDRILDRNFSKNSILDNKKKVVLYAMDRLAEKVYNELLAWDIEVDAFVIEEYRFWETVGKSQSFSGLPVYHLEEAVRDLKDAVYITAAGKSKTVNDRKAVKLEYLLGTQRHTNVWRFNRIEEIESKGLREILKRRKQNIVLAGNPWVCEKAGKYMKGFLDREIYFMDLYDGRVEYKPMGLTPYEIGKDKEEKNAAFYLSGIPWNGAADDMDGIRNRNNEFVNTLHNAKADDISIYFSDTMDIWREEEKTEEENTDPEAGDRIGVGDIRGMVLGVIQGYSGNTFVKDLLDGHPNILRIPMSSLESKLWFFARLLEGKNKEAVISEFRMLCDIECRKDRFFFSRERKEVFFREYEKCLQDKKHLSSKEIFAAVFIAYFYTIGRKHVAGTKYVLYFEPHLLREQDEVNTLFGWGKRNFDHMWLLNSIRDPIKRMGTGLKGELNQANGVKWVYRTMEYGTQYRYKECGKEDWCAFRFEDLKKYPREVLEYICGKIGIPWSDTLLHTTRDGRHSSFHNGRYQVADFDLRPVYNQYEEYFSDFDRFRLDILLHAVRSHYGYSDLNIECFSKKQILEWMKYPFKFEQYMVFNGEANRLEYKKRLYDSNKLLLEMQDENEDEFGFVDYFHTGKK